MEDSSSDQTRESSGEDVAGIEDGDARGDLLARLEDREDVESSGVVWCFGDAEEEASQEQTREVFAESRKGRDDSPERHAAGHLV